MQFVFLGLALLQGPAENAWHADLDKANKEAASRKVPLMLYFTFAECFHAKRFEKSILRDEAVVATLNQRFVCVKIDVASQKDLAHRFGIEGCPTMVFVTAEGRSLERVVGYQDVDVFRAILRRVKP